MRRAVGLIDADGRRRHPRRRGIVGRHDRRRFGACPNGNLSQALDAALSSPSGSVSLLTAARSSAWILAA